MTDPLNQAELMTLFDELYLVSTLEEEVISAKNEADESYLISGDHESKIVVVIDSQSFDKNPEDAEFLEKVMSAVNLSLNEIAIYGNGKKALGQLTSKIKTEEHILFCFGLETSSSMKSELQMLGKSKISNHPKLSEVSADRKSKKVLWSALQELLL